MDIVHRHLVFSRIPRENYRHLVFSRMARENYRHFVFSRMARDTVHRHFIFSRLARDTVHRHRLSNPPPLGMRKLSQLKNNIMIHRKYIFYINLIFYHPWIYSLSNCDSFIA